MLLKWSKNMSIYKMKTIYSAFLFYVIILYIYIYIYYISCSIAWRKYRTVRKCRVLIRMNSCTNDLPQFIKFILLHNLYQCRILILKTVYGGSKNSLPLILRNQNFDLLIVKKKQLRLALQITKCMVKNISYVHMSRHELCSLSARIKKSKI